MRRVFRFATRVGTLSSSTPTSDQKLHYCSRLFSLNSPSSSFSCHLFRGYPTTPTATYFSARRSFTSSSLCHHQQSFSSTATSTATSKMPARATVVSASEKGDGIGGKQQRRTRLLYVAVALSEIDHVGFHRLKFEQLCKVTRADAPNPFPAPSSPSPAHDADDAFELTSNKDRQNAEEDYVDFRMLAFSKEGTFVTQWIADEDRHYYEITSPIAIPDIEEIPFEQPIFVDNDADDVAERSVGGFSASRRSSVSAAVAAPAVTAESASTFSKKVLSRDTSTEQLERGGGLLGLGLGLGRSTAENGENTQILRREEDLQITKGGEDEEGDDDNNNNARPATVGNTTRTQSVHIRVDNTIIEGRRDEANKRTFCLVRVSEVCAFDLERMRHFLELNMAKEEDGSEDITEENASSSSPTNTAAETDSDGQQPQQPQPVENQLVFGAHGYGFALGVNVRVVRGEDDNTATVDRCAEGDGYFVSISLIDLVRVLEGMRFRSICFDCCLMSTAQTASSMYKVTSHVVACEGYMWEEDDDIEKHVLNSHSARYLCFGVSGGEEAFEGHRVSSTARSNSVGTNNSEEQQQQLGGKAKGPITHGLCCDEEVSGNDDGGEVEDASATISGKRKGRDEEGIEEGSPSPRSIQKTSSFVSIGAHEDGDGEGPEKAMTAVTLSNSQHPYSLTAEDAAPTTALTKALVRDNQQHEVVPELIAVSRHFSSNSTRGDVAVINTEAGTLLYHHLLLSKAQIVRFLHRPASLTTTRPLGMDILGPPVHQCSPLDSRDPEVGSFLYDIKTVIDTIHEHLVAEERRRQKGAAGKNNSQATSSPSSLQQLLGSSPSASPPPSPPQPQQQSTTAPPLFSSRHTTLSLAWVDKANELLSAAVVFNLPPDEAGLKYYTCPMLKGLSVKL